MIFDFSAKAKVMVTMMEYIKNIIKDLPEDITGTKTSPVVDHLLLVRGPSLAKVLQGGASNGVPFRDGSTPVSECKGTGGHSAHHCFSNHASEVAIQRQLGQGQKGDKLPERYSAHAPHPVGRLADTLTVVGGCSVRCARQLLGAYRGGDELWPRNGPQLFLEAKDQNNELDRSQTGWGEQLAGVHSLGSLLYAEVGIWHVSITALSGQHECYPDQDQQEGKQFHAD
jgi:hypothetical protein